MKRMLSLLLVLATMIVIPAAQAAPLHQWPALGTHTVQSGETIYCIARAYGVDPWAITAQNGIIQVNLIYPGIQLSIPNAPATIPPGPVCVAQFGSPAVQPPTQCTYRATHVIMTGDTLTSIAARYNANLWDIARCNGLYNINYIRIGDTLGIP